MNMKCLKTYGKQKTKLPAWISIQDRKQIFDITPDSEADSLNQQQASKTTRIRNNRNAAKKKSYQQLSSEDEENIFPHPSPLSHDKPAQRRKQSKASSVRTRKRKLPSLSVSSDEEYMPPTQNAKPVITHKKTRRKKSKICNDKSTNNKTPDFCSDQNKCPPNLSHNSVPLPSTGRFVTRRKRAFSPRPLMLNSSDEFSKSRIIRPLRKRHTPAFLESSADSSLRATALSSFVTIPLRDISLNESAEHSLGPCSRKPIFCSTPSAAPLDKRSKLQCLNPTSSPPSISVSCIGPVGTSQADLCSPEQLTLSVSVSPSEPFSEKQVASERKYCQSPHEELSSGAFMALSKSSHNMTSSSGVAYSQCEEVQTQGSNKMPSICTISSDSSSYFTSATGDLDWLNDVLKEKCLTQLCTVRLERLEELFQLLSQTTYSSCLGDLRSICCSIDSQSQDKAEQLSTIIKNECLSREFSVQLEKLPQSSIELHLTPDPNPKGNDQSKSQRNSTTDCQSPTESQAVENLSKELKEQCLNNKPLVKMRKTFLTEMKYELQDSIVVLDRNASELASEESEHQSTMADPKEAGRHRKSSSASSNEQVASDKNVFKTSSNRQSNKQKRITLASKEKKRRTSAHRTGTTRKACVSGLSVSRWKSRDAFTSEIGRRGVTKAVDCSINELIPSQHNPVELTDFSKNFSTPLKGSNVSLSSLLTELTPNTHKWSRLKAALSIHRKVILTPKTPGPGQSAQVGLADLSQDLFPTPFRTTLPKRLRSQLMTHECQLVFEDDELSDAEKVYAECSQRSPLPWTECLLPQRMKHCVKIGEGTFGEVFSTTSGKSDKETVALKVIPVEGSKKVNGEEQKTFGEILHEIIISKELSCLNEKEKNQTSGFIGLRDLHCVKGCYPPEFLKAWDKFDKQKHSENDRPDFFEKEQLFIILEFEFGGSDLENCNGTLPSLTVAKSILQQVTAALAVAEQELHFEHRDLHWGNVLVKMTKQKTTDFSLNGTVHSLETKGVHVRIIDYSLSRMEIDELTVSCDIAHDEELFMGQGDYQFDIYRLMRQENGNVWSGYNPHSNVLWLHYLCSKLLDMRYRGSGRRNKDMRDELTSFYDNVLRFSSATEVLQSSSLFQ